MRQSVFEHPEIDQYSLLDSGGAEKLERFGAWVLRRPDPQALWSKRKPSALWDRADLKFTRESDRGGRWERGTANKAVPESWVLDAGLARFLIRPTPFKHVGLFPEQAANWDWVETRRLALAERDLDRPRLLNLFAYSGAATVLAALAGWQVTHVDASRAALNHARENAELNGLASDAIRWMLEDAALFAAREVRRGRRYHGILLDPPHYGRGPKGEKWQFERDLAPILENCRQLLDPEISSFVVLSTYAIGYSPLAFQNMLQEFGPGSIETGELAIPEEDGERRLPCGFCARFLSHA